MSAANFNLRSWNSNSSIVREMAKVDHVLDNDGASKVLGMRWDAVKDTISFPERLIPVADIVTKRTILHHTSRMYDPLELLIPVTIRAKIILQELWEKKYAWDSPVPHELQQKWQEIARDMNSASSSSFNRCLFNFEADGTVNAADETILHVFSDASMTSYGAAVYICRVNQSALVMAKSRVAPLKKLTLPRLELMAAVIGARLGRHVQQQLNISKMELWSDSQITLHWLQSMKSLQRFVRNRVEEIHQLTDNRKWRYCPTKENPADLLTRGISAVQFSDNTLWFKGPQWIDETDKWPTWDYQSTTVCITGTDHCDEPEPQSSSESSRNTIAGIHTIIDVTRYSTLGKLLRVTAYVLRFAQNCRLEVSARRLEHLTASELKETEELWLRSYKIRIQASEIKHLKSNGNRLPLVKQLRLFLDATGFVRYGGRIHNAPLSENTKFPYLLPHKHPFTRLVVIDAHERLLHSGSSSTITYLRQKYWIPVIRRCVQSVLRACVICRRVNGNSYHAPDPPPLPKIRVEDAEPFTVTGVDFTGALYVRDKDGHEKKAYICLFTCASTRAVHLELVPDLTTETILQAFRRFCSRKSLPRLMISDNATTYIGAANHQREHMQSNAVQEELNNKGTEWRFIVKRAPWYGGWWERLIGLTKTAVKKVLGRSYVDFETLSTIITEVEAVINDRPLTYVTSGEVEAEPLTPSHLLYGRRLTKLPHSEDIELSGPRASNFENITRPARTQKKLIDNFRVRWKTEYLTALREHHRVSGKNQQTIKVHNETPRSSWKLAVVEETITGNDGLVRAARIRTQNGRHTTRPIVKLYPLEVMCDTVSARD